MSVRIVVPISGGKDSQACLKLAMAYHKPEDVRGLFCDTKFEHPDTYAHVERLRTLYGPLRIDTVCGGSVEERSLRYGRFPGGGARHCTDWLKIRETRIYAKRLAEEQSTGFELWFGMRSQESSERKNRYAGKVCDEAYAPHEVLPKKYPKYFEKLGIRFRLAVLHWSTLDVLEYLDGDEHPHYAEGFDRVGCFPCLAAGDAAKEKAFKFDLFGASQYNKVIRISKEINKSIWTSKGGAERNATSSGCSFCDM